MAGVSLRFLKQREAVWPAVCPVGGRPQQAFTSGDLGWTGNGAVATDP